MPLAMTGPQVCWKRTRNSSAAGPLSTQGLRQAGAEHEGDDDREGVVVARGEQAPGARGRTLDDRCLLGVDSPTGHDVGPVAVHRDEQRLQRTAQRAEVLVDQDAPHEPHQAVDLGRLHVVDDEPLGLGDDVVERDPVGRGIRPEPVERVDPGGRQ